MDTIRTFRIMTAFALVMLIFGGCTWSRTAKGGAIGGTAGGVIGGVVGKKAGNTAAGVIIGATVGGVAGAAIGKYMDKQAEELERDLENAKIERVGEGIKITFDSGIMFDFDSYQLKPTSRGNIEDLAIILNKYQDTEVLVQGHTDSKGSEEYNQRLSERRAESVAFNLNRNFVNATRITIEGFGEDLPVADNNSDYGRQQNRRVEVAIYGNKKLQKAAERGDKI